MLFVFHWLRTESLGFEPGRYQVVNPMVQGIDPPWRSQLSEKRLPSGHNQRVRHHARSNIAGLDARAPADPAEYGRDRGPSPIGKSAEPEMDEAEEKGNRHQSGGAASRPLLNPL